MGEVNNKSERSARAAAAARARWAAYTPEQKAAQIAKLNEARAAKRQAAKLEAQKKTQRSERARRAANARWAGYTPEQRAAQVAKLQEAARKARQRRQFRLEPEVWGAPQPAEPITPPLEAEGRPTPEAWEYRETRDIDGRKSKLSEWMAELPAILQNAPSVPLAVRVDVVPDQGQDVGIIIVVKQTDPVKRAQEIASTVAYALETAARGVLYNEGVDDAKKPAAIPKDAAAIAAYGAVLEQITAPYDKADPHSRARVTLVIEPATPADVAADALNRSEEEPGDDEIPF